MIAGRIVWTSSSSGNLHRLAVIAQQQQHPALVFVFAKEPQERYHSLFYQ
jgi:hypothetical protein